ncbi:MAG: ParB/RepB/Spo0J family partition protein [Endomicrobiia bacterium]
MKKHLGKGIEALISEVGVFTKIEEDIKKENVLFLDISKIEPPKWQPRKKFDQEKLQQLAESIKQTGIIEPLIVAPKENDRYEIICGERRYRAAIIANQTQIPAIIKILDEKQKMLLSLTENIQREDLNPVEEAEAYKKLIEEFSLTQEELSSLIGKDRSVIANTLRILSLPKEVMEYIEDGLISAGHARSLASIKDENLVLELTNKIVQDKLTVRDIENIVKQLKTKKVKTKQQKIFPSEVLQIQREISEFLGTKVQIKPSSNTKGKIIISYSSLEEFENIIKKLKK